MGGTNECRKDYETMLSTFAADFDVEIVHCYVKKINTASTQQRRPEGFWKVAKGIQDARPRVLFHVPLSQKATFLQF